jgi:hypothetical protein
MTEFPTWLNTLCAVSVATGLLCALVILFAEFRHPNHMVIMRIVWPVCALFGTECSFFGCFFSMAGRWSILQADRGKPLQY